MFNNLFEDDPFIQQKKAEGRAEGIIEGEARGMQKAVVTIIEGRFPSLVPLARQKVKRVSKPELLNILLRQVAAANDEGMARVLLDSFAA